VEISYARSRLILMILMVVMAVFILADIFEDYEDGVKLGHLAIEGVLLLISAGVFISLAYLWLKDSSRVKSLEKESRQLKAEIQSHLQGLAKVVEQQFKIWNLTPSEQDVGFLLLKGLSVKEIASLRDASEKTVQAQTQAIYKKSSLHSRSEFAAFFLEDLLPPRA
jgi:DNA-binding CsgD family transcriptional regulator